MIAEGIDEVLGGESDSGRDVDRCVRVPSLDVNLPIRGFVLENETWLNK